MKKNKMIFVGLLGVALAHANAIDLKTANQEQNIAPTYCEIDLSAKIPSCTISIRSTGGSKLSTYYVQHKNSDKYIEDPTPSNPDFTQTDDFTSTPLVAVFQTDGVKQVRLTFNGQITPELTKQEGYGRFLIKVDKEDKSLMHNLPVFISNGKKQAFNITNATLGAKTFSFKDGQGKEIKKTVPTLTMKNDGDGILATSLVTFGKKSNDADYNLTKDFQTLNLNVLPHSEDTILLLDEKLAEGFQKSAGKTVVFLNKRNMKFVEVKIEK